MAEYDTETLSRALFKRGFKADDPYWHECPTCHERSIQKFTLQSKLGGRDIDLCMKCGGTWSWSRRRSASEERTEDADFDLVAFLRL